MPKRISLRADSRGVAALEFALVAPLMIALLIGVSELTGYIRAQMKLNHAAGLLGKMIAQQTTAVTSGKTGILGNLCYGAGLVMTPLATTSFSGAIASVSTTASGTGQVTKMDWESDASCATAATAIGATAAANLATATGLVPDIGDSLIILKVGYTYTPVTQMFMAATTTLTQTIYVRPRANATITCSNC